MADDSTDPEVQADARIAELQAALDQARDASGSSGFWYNLTHPFTTPSDTDSLSSAQTQYNNTANEFENWRTDLRSYAEDGVDPAGNAYTWQDWNNFGNNIANELNLGAKVWHQESLQGAAQTVAAAIPKVGDELEKYLAIGVGVVVLLFGLSLVVRR